MTNFQRTKFRAYVKLGLRQKSKRRYVKARGRHNKTRQKEKSHPVKVEIGFRNKVKTRGLINGKIPVVIRSLKDLKGFKKENIAIIGNIGAKAKIEIAKNMLENKIEAYGINLKKFLEKIEKKTKKEEPAKAKENKPEEKKQ